VKPQSNSLPVA